MAQVIPVTKGATPPKFKPGTSVTKLPTIDVARATSRLLEVRWVRKLGEHAPAQQAKAKELVRGLGRRIFIRRPGKGDLDVLGTVSAGLRVGVDQLGVGIGGEDGVA